jgi:hypothetical protein
MSTTSASPASDLYAISAPKECRLLRPALWRPRRRAPILAPGSRGRLRCRWPRPKSGAAGLDGRDHCPASRLKGLPLVARTQNGYSAKAQGSLSNSGSLYGGSGHLSTPKWPKVPHLGSFRSKQQSTSTLAVSLPVPSSICDP